MERQSFYLYRLPMQSEIKGGIAYNTTTRLNGTGFMIAPYSMDKDYILIPQQQKIGCDDLPTNINYNTNINISTLTSTSVADYYKEIKAIQQAEDNGIISKGVACRRKIQTGEVNVKATFMNLCELYPNAYIYLFHTPLTGTWIGASPERLLSKMGTEIFSMALAGTRPVSVEVDWDLKNIKEQEIVEEYILKCISTEGPILKNIKRYTKNAGHIEHICSEMEFHINDQPDIYQLLKRLTPTPALCGMPKKAAYDMISSLENFDRNCYGGFNGPVYDNEGSYDFELFVTIRCAQIFSKGYILYGGGGIMPESIPKEEWDETENKMQILQKGIKTL